jgi:magnesium transporter
VSAGRALLEHYAVTCPDEVARRMERLDPGSAVVVLSALPSETAAALLLRLAPGHAARIVADLSAEVAAAVTGAMRVEGAASLLRRMEPAVAAGILGALPAERARGIGALLAHGPATAGGVMDPDVFTAPLAATVADVRALLEATPEHLYYYVYVVDAEQRLAGVFDLAELMQAASGDPVGTLVRPGVTWLSAEAPLESVFAHPGWRSLDAMPVVDRDRHFLGVLRHRRMRQLQEQEQPAAADDRTVRTVMALGEIYWLGLCGLLQGIAATATESAIPGDAS